MQFYVIAGVLRSGTELLCRMLSDVGVGYPREYLNGTLPFLGSYAAYIDRIREHQPGETVGIKILATQFNELVTNHPAWASIPPDEILDTLIYLMKPDSVQYILMDRRDRVAQAVSAIRAEDSGMWHHPKQSWKPVELAYEPKRIEGYIQSLEWAAIYWRTYFAQRCLSYHMIWYEDFTHSPDTILHTVRETSAYLGHSLNGHQIVIPFEKSAKEQAQKIIKRYKAEHGYVI